MMRAELHILGTTLVIEAPRIVGGRARHARAALRRFVEYWTGTSTG